MEKFIRPAVRASWLSAVDGGMRREISATIGGLEHPLITILADEEDECLWVELYVDGTAVQIPAAALQRALDDAVGEVHSESWYDHNQPSGHDVQ